VNSRLVDAKNVKRISSVVKSRDTRAVDTLDLVVVYMNANCCKFFRFADIRNSSYYK